MSASFTFENSQGRFNCYGEHGPRPRVKFHPEVLVKKTLHLRNYTNDEISATWYNNFDFEMIKANVWFTLSLLESGQLTQESSSTCDRGIELWTKKRAKLRNRNRAKARSAVLNEQTRQWEDGISNPERIARRYVELSYPCQARAHHVALKDKIDAIQHYCRE